MVFSTTFVKHFVETWLHYGTNKLLQHFGPDNAKSLCLLSITHNTKLMFTILENHDLQELNKYIEMIQLPSKQGNETIA